MSLIRTELVPVSPRVTETANKSHLSYGNSRSRIPDHISSGLRRFSALLKRLDLVISTFLEYRTALISAAVTGKIDVRGVVAAKRT
jgi:hypothetical protein